MANEITLRYCLTADKGGSKVDSSTQTKQLTMAGDDMIAASQIIASANDEAIVTGEVTLAGGYMLIKNLDSTNLITLSTGTGGGFAAGTFAKVRSLCVALFEPVGVVYAQATSAPVRVQIWAVEA